MATTAGNDVGTVAVAADDIGGQPGDQPSSREVMLEHLRRHGYRFNFFQAVRLLENAYAEAPSPGTTVEARREAVRVRPDTSLVFPATDVRRVAPDDGRGAAVTVTFMGLYGIASPLPEFFYEVLATEQEEAFPLRDFLDIFNQRIYTAFYRAWKKYRPEHRRLPDRTDRDSRRFFALGGVTTPGVLDEAPVPRALLAAYAARLMPHRRNAEGLEVLLSAWLDLRVRVVENVPRWVPIRERPTTGRGGGLLLGKTAVVGQKVFDRMGKFRLQIGPMDRATYLELLPRGAKAAALQWLVRTYLTDYLDFDVELRLQTDDLPPARLGDSSCRLGWSTCLGSPREDVLSNVVHYASN